MPSVKKKYLLISAILLVGLLAVLGYVVAGHFLRLSPQNQPPIPTRPIISSPTIPVETSSTDGMKTYRNEQFGFEFQYPQNWIVLEKSFGGYYSKFNVVVGPTIGAATADPSPFLVNIVLPEFADRTFLGSNPVASTVIVAGVSGIKYKYMFEGSPETAIVLPFRQFKVILGSGEPYQSFFDQIVSTFKFSK